MTGSILSNPLSPLAPYATAIKLGAIGVVGVVLLGFLWSWHARGEKIDSLTETQTQIVNAATLATVEPDAKGHRKLLKPADVPAAITALANSYSSAMATLRGISKDSKAAQQASAQADAALGAKIDAMQAKPAKDEAGWASWDPWGN